MNKSCVVLYGFFSVKHCCLIEVSQCASSQESPGQRVFHCLACCFLSGHAPGEPFLEQYPLFGGPVPKVCHGDLVRSAISITGVSTTFFFILTFVNVSSLFKPMASFKSLVPFLATNLSPCLLCVNTMFLLSLRK